MSSISPSIPILTEERVPYYGINQNGNVVCTGIGVFSVATWPNGQYPTLRTLIRTDPVPDNMWAQG